MKIWLKMNRPVFVAPLVATKEEQWSPLPAFGRLVVAGHEGAVGEGVGGVRQGGLEVARIHIAVQRDDVQQVDGTPLELGAGLGGAIGDALHLLQELQIELAQEEGVGELALVGPAPGGIRGVLLDRELGDEAHDLVGHELAVLATPGVGRALDVQEGPAAHLIAEALPAQRTVSMGMNRVDVLHLLELHVG